MKFIKWLVLIISLSFTLVSCRNLKKVVMADENLFLEFAEKISEEDFFVARMENKKIEFSKFIEGENGGKVFTFSHSIAYENKFDKLLKNIFRINKMGDYVFFSESGTISGRYCGVVYSKDDEVDCQGLTKLERLFPMCFYFEGYPPY